ncbi:MAG: hypothetical protein BA863_14080 [Desulfovibrio sp. S3730MH75]|nr:MAG: hypothetical protein BA863_14080 [Desulfovibrio sp. S3730MH75]
MPESKPKSHKSPLDKNTIFWTIIVPTLLAAALYTYNRMDENVDVDRMPGNGTKISIADK